MFNDIGKKLKVLAETLCWIGIVLSVISGIVMFVNCMESGDFGALWAGVGIILFGCLFSWIGSFFTYGFGELIEKATEIAENTSTNQTANTAQNPNQQISPTDQTEHCYICGKTTGKLTRYMVNDNNGSRICKLCAECQTQVKISDVNWTCPYCGHQNIKEAAKCENCQILKR